MSAETPSPAPVDGAAITARDVEELLAAEPWRYDFFHAVRLVECAHPDRPRVGTAPRATDEPVRLAQEPSLAFAPAAVAAFKPTDSGGPARLSVHFFGLFGPNGPLPLHLTEYARDRIRHRGDRTFSRFADIFHHRMLSLFYRARASAEPAIQFDRPEEDRYAAQLGALFGLGMRSMRDRDTVPDLAKLHYAGRLSSGVRSREGLESVLADFFEVETRVEEFVGRWIDLPPESHMKLGESELTGSLGTTATVGTRVWDRQSGFRIVLGPMGYDDYERFLPGGESLKRLSSLVENYVGHELIWDLGLVLRREEVPRMELGRSGRLGWTTFALSGPARADADELILEPVD